MNKSAPIGIFDSGIGGISVLKEIRQLLPNENLLYIADSKYAPYGNENKKIIVKRSFTCADFLVSHNAKAIVVACNTATAAAASSLRKRYNLPIIAMEPAVKPAVNLSKNGMIGIIATTNTLESKKFESLLTKHAKVTNIKIQPCPGLVNVIEQGNLDSPQLTNLLKKYIYPLCETGIDTLILGCTHYPLVRDHIKNITGPHIMLIDSGEAVARHLRSRLIEEKSHTNETTPGVMQFATTGHPDKVKNIITRLLGQQVNNIISCS